MGQIFFSTEKMTVGYGGVPLIREIDVSLEKGEILTLIGPNGAGKSTILKSIAGQLALLCGTVLLDGKALGRMPRGELARHLAVVLTRQPRTGFMTCREVVAAGRYPYTGRLGILSVEDKKMIREAMELTDTADLADQDFLTLSDGQRQRVMLARAMAQEPEVLVLDEPTSYLDIRYKLEFLSMLQRMARERGLVVILSLHELELAERISDKILCVKGEYVERLGTPEAVFQPGYIEKLYGLTRGSFDGRMGRVELEKVVGKPEVFVIAGGGSGIPVYRRLQREGTPFSTGILWENDLDMPVAEALAVRVIREKAFQRIGPGKIEEAEREIGRCERVLCALRQFGELNRENERLLAHAKSLGKCRFL